ncbi:hypothetical protein ASPZODRAFT_127964 [Penicilliopsis zonata CBS 506.65]|uniref:Ubiquitin carboxyl-terminal hydrolase n=1 Tax=Penicilliopsis zonata CBS 506.65 TaxID=1073090 RepID=A0A1L9SQW4_9EURO|nr:hypothetical protein ASPZODRAFT_127964 [Penicilliopsis zonata CBS 506.65]OJJ49497.1 hypothetical protein ASPZODRAFT_127964 [Penicilliopsis zonata CBS 506.65]
MASCPHVHAQDIKPPGPSEVVYREDCTQCFDSIDDEAGLNVCLHCFDGGCAGEREHGILHYKRFKHPLALNIKRTRRKVQRDEPPFKISKLAIAAETDEDRYDTITKIVCYECPTTFVNDGDDQLSRTIEGVMKAMTYSKKEEIKAWEQEFIPCQHTLNLSQQGIKQREPKGLRNCSMCDLKENIWLCLECGSIGCGRSQFGGIGGNSHALAHADMSSHAVAVKLGSLTADGTADIYCYKCNEERVDPNLSTHLAHWGINVADCEKTEKSLMEMQIDHNMRWEFSMMKSDGHELSPVFGPGLTGLTNLGNSCYLSSIVQSLFSLPEFQKRYFLPMHEQPAIKTPAQDFETQMRKLADGILSGRYSRPDTHVIASPDSPEVPHQRGLSPSMFKHLVGRNHEEFSTMRQQDAFEFLLHLFKLIGISRHDGMFNPIDAFRFAIEQRLQCVSCAKVRYRVDEQDNISVAVPARRLSDKHEQISSSANSASLMPVKNEFAKVAMEECLDIFTSEEIVELECPSCMGKDGFRKRSLFRTLPQELIINARRFQLINWVPTKLDIPVDVRNDELDFTSYLASGPRQDEELLPDTDTSAEQFKPNQISLDQLISMGFPAARCEKALFATGNSDTETAMNWLFAHMDDPGIDNPLHTGCATSSKVEQDPAKIAHLGEMGIEASRASKALAATNGDVNRALDWVFSHPSDPEDVEDNGKTGESEPKSTPGFSEIPAKYKLTAIVCHKGTSVHAGHYVAFIRKVLPGDTQPSWVLFNDEKVVKIEDIEEMRKFAYLYFFSRI